MRSFLRAAAGLVLLLIAGLTIAAPSAAAKTYSAERFDSHVRVMPGGALEVTETVVFRFESGTFDHVFREIPARRTDGIDIISAGMDGRPFPSGDGVNTIQVSGRSKVRVQWRFQPVADSTHVFVLTYAARGVVSQTSDADVLSWRALPTEHEYRIASSTVDFDLPGSVAGGNATGVPTPKMDWRRIDGPVDARIRRANEDVAAPALLAHATAQQIRTNGWLELTFDLPRGSILAAPPAWQQLQQDILASAPRWMTAALLILLSGLIMLFGLRQQYDAPARDQSAMPGSPAVPDSLAPGLVGPLLSNGRTSLEHAMATLFSLAERGIVSIEERPHGRFGQRSFDVRRRPSRAPLAAHESTLLTMALDQATIGEAVTLSSVRRRLVRGLRQFSAAARQDLMAAGLIDRDRERVRDRYVRVSIGVLVIAVLGVVGAAAALVSRYGAWPMLVPAALALIGMAGLIFAAATTPLSNEGLRRAARWRGFRGYLKGVSQDREQPAVGGLEALLPFAVATGLSASWAKYLKRHPGQVPGWFRALSTASQDSAFTAFVTSTGAAGAHGGGAHGAGGAAGGGGSGAG